MSKRGIFVILVISLVTASTSFAERKPSKAKRRISNAPEEETETTPAPAPLKKKWFREMGLRGGVSLGLSTIVDGPLTPGSNNFAVGVLGDFTEMRYFGLEVDGFYSIPAKQDNVRSEAYGGVGFFKLLLPLNLDIVKVTPKAGAGYGYFSVKESNDFGENERANVHGFHVMGGLDLEVFDDILVSFDYAQAIKPKAKLQSTSEDGSSDLDLSDPASKRIRLGAFYRVVNHIILGLQFIRRDFKYGIQTLEDGDLTLNPIQNNYLFVVMYEY